jgi:hypothetical protein
LRLRNRSDAGKKEREKKEKKKKKKGKKGKKEELDPVRLGSEKKVKRENGMQLPTMWDLMLFLHFSSCPIGGGIRD